MKVLIIDNGTSYLKQLQNLLSAHDFTTINFSEISRNIDQNFELVILSGGHKFPVVGNEDKLKKEIDFIKNYQKPIFGICFGFELIALTFSATLEKMDKKERGIIDIEVIETNEMFSNLPNFKVFENHRWIVKNIGTQLIALGKSRDGIEIIKHNSKPIYAVQFHPEMFIDTTCGDEIFHNLLNLIQAKRG